LLPRVVRKYASTRAISDGFIIDFSFV